MPSIGRGQSFSGKGRVGGNASAGVGGFTIVTLPDIQNMTESDTYELTSYLSTMANWIVASKSLANIVAVISEGDIANSATTAYYNTALPFFNTIAAAGIPYTVAIGNHDYDGASSGSLTEGKSSVTWDSYFGPSLFAGKSWYGSSSFPTGSNRNSYITFTVAGQQYLILNLEFFPYTDAIAWAQGVVSANPNAIVIVQTHGYMNPDGSLSEWGGNGPPSTWGLTTSNAGDGVELWNTFLSVNPNIVLVVCGHNWPTTAPYAAAANIATAANDGHKIVQILANYQAVPLGTDGGVYTAGWNGNGYIRLMQFHVSTPGGVFTGTIDNRTLSPIEYVTLDTTGPGGEWLGSPHQFVVSYP
jgi:hypothetical protein